jgi:hypothetical protein
MAKSGLTGQGGPGRGQGRKSALDEKKIAALSMRCVHLTLKYVNNESIPIKDRADVFSRIAAKVVPQSLSIAGEMTHNMFFQDIIEKSKGV